MEPKTQRKAETMTTATAATPETLDDQTSETAEGMEFDTSAAETNAENSNDVDQAGDEDQADDDTEATDAAGKDSEANEEQVQGDIQPPRKMTLAEQKQSLIEEIIGQREKVRVAEADVAADQQALKDSRAVLGKRQATLGQLIDRLEEVNKGQQQLPFRDDHTPSNETSGEAAGRAADEAASETSNVQAEDIHGQAPVSVLKLSKGMLEKLEEAEVETIQDLERRIATGDFVPGAIKGIGQSAVDKITDALVAYRNECPVPSAG